MKRLIIIGLLILAALGVTSSNWGSRVPPRHTSTWSTKQKMASSWSTKKLAYGGWYSPMPSDFIHSRKPA